jgi:hypothetical protein
VKNYFKIQELVPPAVYADQGERAWRLIDSGLVYTLNCLRHEFGPITINNWHIGGPREWSGLRTPDSPYYSPGSYHSCGQAADCLFSNAEVSYVRLCILKLDKYPLIGGIELDVPWLHVDVRQRVGGKIVTFSK